MTENNNMEMDIDLKRMAERQQQKKKEQMQLHKELGDWMTNHERSNQVTLRISADKMAEIQKLSDPLGMSIFEDNETTIELQGEGIPEFEYKRVFRHQYEQFKWDPEEYELLSLDTNAGLLLLTRKGNSDEDTNA